uniref:Leukocyte cell-derived chemotaxin 1 n=1 Tax=Oncorhynchus mykiss TaxID=8022 RepID=A0A8C7LTN4_ONCMY
MAGCSEKEPIALVAFMCKWFMCSPQAYTAVAVKPAAILLLFGAIGAFYFWNNNNNHFNNVHYSMSIKGKVEEGSAVEVHDFQLGITGVRLAGGEKCYIKTQVKAHLPDVKTLNKDSLLFDLDEVTPAKFEEQSWIWVAADVPLSDPAFLSIKIRDLCGDLQIFWLRHTYTNNVKLCCVGFHSVLTVFVLSPDGQRKRRAAPHQRRQVPGTEEVDPEAEFNPENPYHGTMTFDPMLDHQGVCCTECRRSHTPCQRICEPLDGFQPWPYHYRGCRVACRVIMPCRWWVGRILGIL